MRAFVTGMSGFVGGHLAEHLLNEGDEVVGASRTPSAIQRVRCAAVHHDWDVSRPAPQTLCDELLRFAPDVVFHLAAMSLPRQCGAREPNDAARGVNVEGTRHLLDLIRTLPAVPRLLITSSSYVYAPVGPHTSIVNENSPIGPTTGYGLTKLAAEQLVAQYVADGLPAVVVRAFQHTGPRQSPPLMLPEWAVQLARPGVEIVRVRSLDSYLDLADVRDVVRAYRLLVQPEIEPGTYNVGSGKCRRSGEVLEQLLAVAGVMPRVVVETPIERWHPIADVSKLVRATGWSPRIPWSSTLADVWRDWETGANDKPESSDGDISPH